MNYYAAYKLLTKNGEPTSLHTTVLFRHDTDDETLQKIINELKNLELENKLVHVTSEKYLDGPNGEPNMIKTCLLDFVDDNSGGLEKLENLCKNFTYRRYLVVQHPFTFHTSVGNKDPNGKKYKEYLENQKTLNDHNEFILGDLYLKNMDTKEVIKITI